MNKEARPLKKIFLLTLTLLLLFFFNEGVVSATTSAPQSAGLLTCDSESSIFDCVQIDPYTVRWNIIGNPFDNGNITGKFSVGTPNAPVYLTIHWHYALWVSTYNQQTNPKGYYGIVGAPGRYENDGGTGTTCSHNPNQLCGNYAVGTWRFMQNAVADSYGKVTVGFQQVATPPTVVYWTPQEAFIIVSSLGYVDPVATSAGQLTCFSESSIFDCVQIDPYTVRWNIVGNPYNNGNITGQFSVENPNGFVYVTAHWHSAPWVSVNNQQTNPRGYYGIVGASGRYENNGGSGTPCSLNPRQLCGNYPLGTWNFMQNAVTDYSRRATVGFQQVLTPPATVYWTPQGAYIIVSSAGYGGVPGTPPPTYTPAPTFTPTFTPTLTPSLTPTNTPTFTPTATATDTLTVTPTANCVAGNYQIQGVTGDHGLVEYSGVRGYTGVWDPTVSESSAYVNSLWIQGSDEVEFGWIKRASDGITYFRTWTIQGIYHPEFWGSPAIGSNHEFQVYKNANGEWEFSVDNLQRTPNITVGGLDQGEAGAMRERHNACDSGWAHWWRLQSYSSWGAWFDWSIIDEVNYDPTWFLDTVSQSEFYVTVR